VPEAIHEIVPDARLIYCVGDPLERMVSQWVQWYSSDREHRGIDAALADYENPHNPYVCASRYMTQLERYLAHFDPARVLIVDQEDLRHRRAETLRATFAFLEIDEDVTSPEFARVLNTRDEKYRLRPGLGPVWRRIVMPALWKAPPRLRHRLRPRLKRGLSRPIGRPALDPELRRALGDHLAPELARLRKRTGRDFAGWSV
jgi:hypothetical protein